MTSVVLGWRVWLGAAVSCCLREWRKSQPNNKTPCLVSDSKVKCGKSQHTRTYTRINIVCEIHSQFSVVIVFVVLWAVEWINSNVVFCILCKDKTVAKYGHVDKRKRMRIVFFFEPVANVWWASFGWLSWLQHTPGVHLTPQRSVDRAQWSVQLCCAQNVNNKNHS